MKFNIYKTSDDDCRKGKPVIGSVFVNNVRQNNYEIEINSIDDLINIMNSVHNDVIITEVNVLERRPNKYSIEIYDTYRE